MKQISSVFTTEHGHLLEIIDGLIEGIILLDMNRHIAWANDTALSMHGAAELSELGGTASGYRKRYTLRYRNQRKLLAGQYPMYRALAGDAFKDMVVEVTCSHDPDFYRVHQARGLVLNQAQGKPVGVVLVLLDVTERYSAEERFEKTFSTNPAPAVICSLEDRRYVKVNQGFLQMTGYERQDILDHCFDEIDILGDASERQSAEERLAEGRTISQMETCIPLPDGTDKLVVVAGQPIEVGEAECMLFTFNDLEPRRKAESALRYSEERFSKAFRLAPVPMVLSTLQGSVLEVNDAFVDTTGYTLDALGEENALAGLSTESGLYEATLATLKEGTGVRNRDFRLRTHGGQLLDCLVSAEPVVIEDRPCILGVIQDITERKRSETELMAAIEAVMQDTSWFSQTVIEKLAQIRQPHDAPSSNSLLADLTPREREILGLICQGLSDLDIARTLSVSHHTVRNHVASLYSKLQVHRRSAAIVWARERGVVGHEKSPRAKRSGSR
ncbi:helix-turn-helix transcriptional regulator [Pollutimonas harenae]|uniref:Helix-turn-helix transcriptional regulator n=1 Tax=Pollutimonas harenae TaxID=657015 RepID=A0A853H365_9BURK|nr:helix-turn-helix transcriptional regulator [Pollutimonas harenae]NYT84993.1 helix-turn-helix transcriptional regulator [Pollutimonas harenae]TEA72618.1 helix-turn-helix transcriptional regulator [Pollutimonas harenae]